MRGPIPATAEDVLLLEFALARDGHGLDGETQRLGKDVGRFPLRGDEGGVVAAFHGAVGTTAASSAREKQAPAPGPARRLRILCRKPGLGWRAGGMICRADEAPETGTAPA